DVAAIWVDEDDMAMYAMMAVDDPRTLNKTLYLRPPANILTQMEVVKIWEKLIGKELKKTFVTQEEWLGNMDST
ncbi:NmrA family NAD(P)-binding protein, partial [Mycobacterium kansasii]